MPTDQQQMRSPGFVTRGSVFYGWPLLGVLCLIYFTGFGLTMFAAVSALPFMLSEFGWTRATGSALISVMFITMGFCGPLSALAIRRFGARATMLLGTSFIIVGGGIAAVAVNILTFYFALGLLLGAGQSLLAAVAVLQIISNWFVQRRALAYGLVMSAGGIAALVSAPLSAAIAEWAGDWRNIWYFSMIAHVIVAILVLVFVYERPEHVGLEPDGGQVPAPQPDQSAITSGSVYRTLTDWTYSDAVRSPVFWVITLAASVGTLGSTIVNSQLILHLSDLGVATIFAASLLGLTGLSGVIGRLSSGVIGDKFEPRLIIGIGLVLQASAIALLLVPYRDEVMYVFAIMYGVGFGMILVAMAATLANYFGKTSYGSLIALTGLVSCVIGAVGPVAAGLIKDLTGSYSSIFQGFCVIGLVMAGIVFLTKPPSAQDKRSTVLDAD